MGRDKNEEAFLSSKSNQKYIDGTKGHPAKKCYIFNKRLCLKGWKVQGKHVNGVLEAFEADETFKKRYGIAYKELTAGNTEDMEPVKDVAVNYRPALTLETDLYIPTDPYASFATAIYPL